MRRSPSVPVALAIVAAGILMFWGLAAMLPLVFPGILAPLIGGTIGGLLIGLAFRVASRR